MTRLTSEQVAEVERRCAAPSGGFTLSNDVPLPTEQPARFDRRVVHVMNVSGRDKTWARRRAEELWPQEAKAAAKARMS